ncbi:MAG: hypothetical protein CVU84_06830 [Firmicutes bacterium HGW-Firmicutes-1]|jgi:hypothetical protein|nr:MAG: hypothetical protein CVU84_06830 [Firmicutes bacterium HGW-Firmicutes-1]
MENSYKQQPIETKENQAITKQSETKIENNLYLVTSHYLGTSTLEESILHAINREAVNTETHKTDEKPSCLGYNGNSNIYSR